MHRFRISSGVAAPGIVVLDKKETHHAVSVLRVKPGEVVQLLDGQGGVFEGIVAEIEKFLPVFNTYDLCLIPTLAVPVESLYPCLKVNEKARSILILIGPEGDFSKNEVEAALSAGAKAVTLGSLVLRSETAALF